MPQAKSRAIQQTPKDNVIQFRSGETRSFRHGVKAGEPICTAIVRGSDLEYVGIFDGDLVLGTKTFGLSAITPNTLCLLEHGQNLMIKMVILGPNGLCILRGAGPSTKDIEAYRDEINIIGIIWGIQKKITQASISECLSRMN